MYLISSPARRLAAVVALLAPLLLAALAAAPAPARATTALQSLPFSQSWSNAGLITADNSWDGVPGIVGYSGRDLVVGTGIDPQTILADGSATPVDVLANQSDPAALNPTDSGPGGLVEFDGLADRTIAIGAGPDADAPHLVIHLSTTGFTNVGISYKLRDIDASARNTLNKSFALQYRVGASGSFTNIPGGFVQDATTGPNLATQVVMVNVPLPEAVYNQPQVQLRIITTNAAGDDEWVGVDDISVTAAASDPAPFVERVAPAAASTAPAETDITITFSEPVTAAADAITLVCAGSPVPFAGLPVGAPGRTQIVLDPTISLPTGSACQVQVLAARVADVDGSPTTMVSDYSFSFNVGAALCPTGAALTPIHTVQGSGATTPIPGQDVTVRGVVTALFPNDGSFGGFFMQEEDADHDGNPATSEGIFVATGAAGNPAGVGVGDVVQVRGIVQEISTTGANTQTQLGQPTVADCGTSVPVTATSLSLPVAAADSLERYEGMLVSLFQELTISDYASFDRFGEYVLARPRDGEARLIQPTQAEEPGPAAQARAQENLLRRIIVDDGRTLEYPEQLTHPNGQPFTLANRFRGGDVVTGLRGILAQQFGAYRIQPTAPGTYAARNQRPDAPANVGGTLRVGALSTGGFFLTLDRPDDDPADDRCGPQQSQPCRGASSADELARQRAKLIAAVRQLDPDILGLIELENTPGVSPLADLVAGLNAAVGANTFAFVDTGVVGGDAARVGLIYKPAKAAPAGDPGWLTAATDARFNDTRNWPVLAQSFRERSSGELLTVVVAHLARRDAPCNAQGDPDTGDGQANCNLTRRNAALALVDWLAADPTGSGDPDVLIVGDLNSYAKEAPIDAILAGPDDNPATAADNYVDLILARQGAGASSVVADAQAGYLDHALAGPALAAQVSGAAIPQLSADEPDVLDYDLDRKPAGQRALFEPNAFRSAPHNPVLVGVDPGVDDPDPPPPTPLPTVTPTPGPSPTPGGVRVRLPLVRR